MPTLALTLTPSIRPGIWPSSGPSDMATTTELLHLPNVKARLKEVTTGKQIDMI